MKIFAATGNRHKQQELSSIFAPATIVIPSDINLEFDPEETGDSFVANTIIKAESLWNIVKEPVIADDSGICVDILQGRPGIYSARYGGKDFPNGNPNGKLTDKERNLLLIEEVNIKAKELGLSIEEPISCRFVCAMVYYSGKDKLIVAQETIEGILVRDIAKIRGSGGFGYDPIVYLPEYSKTIAELTEKEKNEISHRGKAARKIKTLISI